MKLNPTNQINLILVILVFFILVLSCDRWAHLNGKILDENGNSVGDAKIILTQSNSKVAEEKSDRDASYKIFESIAPDVVFSSEIKIRVSKEGFQTYEEVLSEEELKQRSIDIVLKRK